MNKCKTLHQCSACGGTTSKWQGQCPHCGAWNTLSEELIQKKANSTLRFQSWAADQTGIQLLSNIQPTSNHRIPTGIKELDQVLGNGLVPGSMTLLGGDPGIGKSTLFLQVIASLAAQNHSVLYVSGEESAHQISLRAKRMNLPSQNIQILSEISLCSILNELKQLKPAFVVIDSIQTIYSDEISSSPGSVSQVRECTAQLTQFAKQTGTSILLVGHVTKDGNIAGPRVLEHMVDTVLYFEGDAHSNFRMIRSIKNRFGASNELGVFAMLESGLIGVSNPSAIFLSSYQEDTVGSCVLVTQEGTRPLLVEIQALIDDAQGLPPKRLTVGLDQNRLAMLLAVLNKHSLLSSATQNIFLNAVGGIKITEPAADLAVTLAIYSSFKDQPLQQKTVVFGEIGLSGEIRPVQRGQERLREAEKLGFTRAIIPKANRPKSATQFPRLSLQPVTTIEEAIESCF
ncbi:MAG: DNA repair protein RadA [Neisseriaceae bacterium]